MMHTSLSAGQVGIESNCAPVAASLRPAARRITRATFLLRAHLVQDRAARDQDRARQPALPALDWTCLYQPDGMICARAQASLPSVLLGIVFIAAMAWHALHKANRCGRVTSDQVAPEGSATIGH